MYLTNFAAALFHDILYTMKFVSAGAGITATFMSATDGYRVLVIGDMLPEYCGKCTLLVFLKRAI